MCSFQYLPNRRKWTHEQIAFVLANKHLPNRTIALMQNARFQGLEPMTGQQAKYIVARWRNHPEFNPQVAAAARKAASAALAPNGLQAMGGSASVAAQSTSSTQAVSAFQVANGAPLVGGVQGIGGPQAVSAAQLPSGYQLSSRPPLHSGFQLPSGLQMPSGPQLPIGLPVVGGPGAGNNAQAVYSPEAWQNSSSTVGTVAGVPSTGNQAPIDTIPIDPALYTIGNQVLSHNGPHGDCTIDAQHRHTSRGAIEFPSAAVLAQMKLRDRALRFYQGIRQAQIHPQPGHNPQAPTEDRSVSMSALPPYTPQP